MSDAPNTDDDRRDAGMRTRREVLGDAWVDRAVAGTTPFTADFQDYITRTAWGDIWQRPGLARRDRGLMTLSITIAQRTRELATLRTLGASRLQVRISVVVEALAQQDPEADVEVEPLSDADEGPDAVRVRITAEAARAFVVRAQRVVAAGRPPCPLCSLPLDPEGHICPRQNGHRR